MDAQKMEFAVQMTCPACEEDVKAVLRGVNGIQKTHVDVENDLVLVETTLTSTSVEELLRTTGKLVLFRGMGMSTEIKVPVAAVAIFRGEKVKGLVRMAQVDSQKCTIEGTLDGLPAGLHHVRVRQFGDVSQGSASCGDVLSVDDVVPIAGELASIQVPDTGRAEFNCVSQRMKVSDLIGRSLTVDSTNTGDGSCAVIARSAGVFQNSKRVCTCDGVTMWDEASKFTQNKL